MAKSSRTKSSRSTSGFPKYASQARKGDAGVNLVSRIVNDDFQWIFKRNHQEFDFGVDGQIEIVSDDGSVTGGMLATQIKYGASFFRERNRWGYVYRGSAKHFNYFANYPIPILIIICEPKSRCAYWVRFQPEQTQATETGWTITIPFDNRLVESKKSLMELVDPTVDSWARLRRYWMTNELITTSSAIVYVLDNHDVAQGDVSKAQSFFDRLRKTKELAHVSQGKIAFCFLGYDDDPRELWEIEPAREYVERLDAIFPELFFYASTTRSSGTLELFAGCVCRAKWHVERPQFPSGGYVEFDTNRLDEFMGRHWDGLNKMTDWLGMSEAENKRISYTIMDRLGIDTAAIEARLQQQETIKAQD